MSKNKGQKEQSKKKLIHNLKVTGLVVTFAASTALVGTLGGTMISNYSMDNLPIGIVTTSASSIFVGALSSCAYYSKVMAKDDKPKEQDELDDGYQKIKR